MLKTSISIICAIFFLFHQSQGISLSLSPSRLGVSRSGFEKRATLHRRTWWMWPWLNGYQSETGDLPSSAYSNNANEGSNANSYGRSTSTVPAESYGRQNLTTGNTSGKAPTSDSEIKEWLQYHNHYRGLYRAAPLKWSEKLVQASKHLIDTCVWQHTQNNQYGENMSAGQSSIKEVVEGWVNGPNEKDSYTGSNSSPSHFTQVIWLSTTEVGCYHSTCSDVRGANLPQSPVTFWACNYNPPGNVIGEFAQNVKAKAGGNPI